MQISTHPDNVLSCLLTDPRLDLTHPLLKAALATMRENDDAHYEAQTTLDEAIKDNETPGVIASLERRVMFCDRMCDATRDRIIALATKLLKGKPPTPVVDMLRELTKLHAELDARST